MKKVGEILKDLRIDRCLLLRQVAAAVNVDSAIISKIETGSRLPTLEQLKALIKFYNVEENEILAAYHSDKLLSSLPEEEDLAFKTVEMLYFKISEGASNYQQIHQQISEKIDFLESSIPGEEKVENKEKSNHKHKKK
ncbi:MAG: helix-turn-helix transcriptional regulator [Bacteroidales bacterium]|nr:helix-turn-helix transcriptional regulator [Bacteroidales bacterium]